MNNRERFLATMSGGSVDRLSHVEHGFWTETRTRWLQEGLSSEVGEGSFSYVSDGEDLYHHFDVAKFAYILPGQYFDPPFPVTVLEENDHYCVFTDAKGIKLKVLKENVSIPMFLDYPIKDRADYDRRKGSLLGRPQERLPEDWGALCKTMKGQGDAITALHMDGFFAFPRELMGLETFLETLYDDPDLIREMIENRADFYIEMMGKPIADMKPDMAFLWEDMCYCNGPLLSPAQFREFMLPAYRKLTDFLRSKGVRNIIVDSDGKIDKLIPLWLEGGVTGLLPFEVKAGMDVVRVGKEYPELQMIGGISKHEIAKGKAAIDKELERVLPAMLKRGRYCVSLDHWVPPDISLQDYSYFVRRVREYMR